VLHFAATASIQQSVEDPFSTYFNNVGSTILALKIASRSRCAFLFMSSYVYGRPRYLPIDEKHPVDHLNPYMGSKIIGEEVSRHLCSAEHLPLVVLRGFMIYGDGGAPGRLIPDLLGAVRSGGPLVVNDPKPKRDYLYSKDFCVLIVKIVERRPVAAGTYNVGYGLSYSNGEVAGLVRKIAGGDCQVISASRPRENDVEDCSVNADLVKKTFSWQPAYSLEQGLTDLIKAGANKKRGI
jgi:UDP-glucose 4-epimerase